MSRKNNVKQCANKIKKVFDNPETVTVINEQVCKVFDPEIESLVPISSEELKQSFYNNLKTFPEQVDSTVNVIYQVVYPDDLNLKPASGGQKSRGRPKKLKIQPEAPPSPQKTKIKVVLKTRSGREVKLPKYIENEFKKIEINDDLSPDSTDVKISDFVKYSEIEEKNKCEPQNKVVDQLDLLQKKRRIPAQYRCPKCQKAYLGRSKILEHLKKNPSHGPMHQNEEKNFEVWNYLVNVTQKCPSSERGPKFCQELSNLLHNLLLLTNALFKKLGSAANEVKVDKVLGNAIGLAPGNYYFDDNNLYKNVTVLKLMANNDFLHSIKSKADDINLKSTILSGTTCNCGRKPGINEMFLKSLLVSPDIENSISKQAISNKILKTAVDAPGDVSKDIGQNDDIKKFTGDEFFASLDVIPQSNFSSVNNYEIKSNLFAESNTTDGNSEKNCKEEPHSVSEVKKVIEFNGKELTNAQSLCKRNSVERKTFTEDIFFATNINLANNFPINDYEMKESYNSQIEILDKRNDDAAPQKQKPSSPKIKIQSNILICPPRFFQKSTSDCRTFINQNVNNKNVNPELMTDNSVLIPSPNLRHSVDELMLSVPSEPNNILDNSSSSDEVMNVDQFVNERFRKITESDLEITNGSCLNLELPSLDLFQFHTS